MIGFRVKCYGSVWKEELSMAYIRTINDIYEGVKPRVRTSTGDTEYFPIDIGSVNV